MHTDDFDGFVVTINGTTHYVDGTVPDKTLNTVSDYNSLLRDMINIPTIHEHYYSNLSREHWAQLCAAMDVIRDSQRAIDKYQEIDQIDYIHGDALYIYGLLNAFYLQQDAATTIFKINTWREDKFERSVANGTETVFVTLRFCVVRKQLKATLKPNAAGVQLPPHYYRNG